MISYYTVLPMKHPILSDENFLKIVQQIKKESLIHPALETDNQIINPSLDNDEEVQFNTDIDSGTTLAGYEISCENGAVFRTTYVLERKLSQLTVYCDETLPDGMYDAPRFPFHNSFYELSAKGLLEADNGLEINSQAHAITDAEADMAARIIFGEGKQLLPVIYVSITQSGNYQINPNVLAKEFIGIAHVVYETSIGVSRIVGRNTGFKVPKYGTIGIYQPNTSKVYYLKRNEYPRPQLISKITYLLRGHMRRVHIQPEKTLAFWRQKNLANVNTKLRLEVNQIYEELDRELIELSEQKNSLESLNATLRNENYALRAQLAQVKKPALLCFCPDEELYPGEYKNIVEDILDDALALTQQGSRRWNIISSVLSCNNYAGVQKKKKQEIKTILKKYEMGSLLQNTLKKVGFQAIRSGNHYIMNYYGSSHSITISKTPSDSKSSANLAQDIIREFL